MNVHVQADYGLSEHEIVADNHKGQGEPIGAENPQISGTQGNMSPLRARRSRMPGMATRR